MEKKQEMLRSRRVDVNTYVRRRRRRRHAPQSQNEVVAIAEPAVQQRQEEAPVAEEQRRRQELSMAAMGRNWKWELQPVEMSYTRRRRRGGAPEEQQREEEAQREETPPPTRRRTPASSDKEAAADAVEQWEEEAPAAEVAEEQHQQETEEVEHFAAAVPIGDPVSVTGRPGRNHKKHYVSFEYNGQTFNLEDTVMVTPEHASQKPYVAVIKDITETEGSLIVTGQWYYRPEEAEVGEVMHSCVVHFIPENKQIPARKKHPGFIVQKVYGAAEKKLWNLKDNGYDDHRQKEIDMLVKRTIDRIGELPDLEPEDTPLPNNQTLQIKDVNQIEVTREPLTRKPENIERLETSKSSELKNYGILALSDVVPIIVALERSAYEALGTDSDKYNHKLTQLWYNIKGNRWFAECQKHSAKACRHSAKPMPRATLGIGHSAKPGSAKSTLPSARRRALGIALPSAVDAFGKHLTETTLR
ncbi:hypothetical protein PR202_ga22692 [Eleusine coracana subsp. coracana]|uniref:BAH domain-containing protein n=1 Tax=Eleusine coracana subsp. coracana TaxID=191504 RepID=A0AAV5D473_ELECO|nr:hypothetical protein PR202_ga22692 [Eleusine coracana subsp. coracana]